MPKATTLILVVVATLLITAPGAAEEGQRSRPAPWVWQAETGDAVIAWQPAPFGLRSRLTVVGPEGLRIEKIFLSGEGPILSLADAPEGWAEGGYTWMLESIPEVDAPTHDLRLPPDEARHLRQLIESQSIRRYGAFGFDGGRFVATETETPTATEDVEAEDGGAARVIAAVVSDSGDQPRLDLSDTTPQSSASGTGTEDDWGLVADSVSDEHLAVVWRDDDLSSGTLAATHPFVITNGGGSGVRSHSLVIQGTSTTGDSRIGINQGAPAEELHISAGLPTLRFDDNVGTLRSWDLEGNSSSFFVEDVTAGTFPFLIEDGAPSHALRIVESGRIGIGIQNPAATLHVAGDGIIAGDVAFGSSRTIKHEIEPVDGDRILGAIRELPLYRWKYRDDPVQAAHVGPMAEDIHAAFRLGRDEKHLSPADSAGLALAAIQELDREMEDLRSENRKLAAQNDELRGRLVRLVELLEQALLPPEE